MTEATFPLCVSENGRYLEDAGGRPFFYQADTAWMLPLRRTVAEADEYFALKKAQGFNAIQLQLTGFLGMRNDEGRLPFGENHDFARPDEAFFAKIDRIFARAAAQNLYLAVAPLWSGCCGEGWAGTNADGTPKPMTANGPDKCRAFGQWLGERYGDFQNLMWILGGDNDPFNAYEEIIALAEGLRAAAPHQLRTYHAASTHSSTDVFPDADWLDISMTYTYFRGFNKAWNKVQPDVYEIHASERRKIASLVPDTETPEGWPKYNQKPFFLGESTYEGEHGDWGSPLQIRKQAWWSALTSATGHAYGSANWKMEDNWRELAELPGAQSLKHLTNLLGKFDWERTLPDDSRDSIHFRPDLFADNNGAITAVGAPGKKGEKYFLIAYIPSPRYVWVYYGDEAEKMYWYDPASGETTPVTGESFDSPERNAAGDTDMVLVVEYN